MVILINSILLSPLVVQINDYVLVGSDFPMMGNSVASFSAQECVKLRYVVEKLIVFS